MSRLRSGRDRVAVKLAELSGTSRGNDSRDIRSSTWGEVATNV